MKFGKLVGVIDVRTALMRFVIFVAGTNRIICYHQVPIQLIFPQDGWCEQDPMEILRTVCECAHVVTRRIERLGASAKDVVAIGIANKGQTTIVWDRKTGKPLYNAIVWWDHRGSNIVKQLMESMPKQCKEGTNKIDFIRSLSGLPLSPYFCALKLRWLKDNVPRVRQAMDTGGALFGTIDSWLIYNITGAERSGIHITDLTNASRTMLMNIETLKWDQKLLDFFELPASILPQIRSNAELYAKANLGNLKDVPIAASFNSSQAALIGHQCFGYGNIKASFGTGCSVMYNSGSTIVHSTHGLITTIAYQLGPRAKTVYALEGNVSTAGLAFEWLRDQMGLINTVNEIEPMARMVPNSLDVYFVPAFNGLNTPHWNQDARGVICGLSEETSSEHIVRATLEAICFQVRDILEAMKNDHRGDYRKLLVNGAMTSNTLFPQVLADLTGVTVLPSKSQELAALGAALTAYKVIEPSFNIEAPLSSAGEQPVYKPAMNGKQRDSFYLKWKSAVQHSLNWDVHMKKIMNEEL